MNVLAILCHPDDMEITCGGTLIKCVKRGDNVTVLHVANGNMGHAVIMPPELRDIRTKEAERAGELAGFKVINGDIGDLLVDSSDRAQIDMVVGVIREAKPDFIITHDPDDYHSDHTEVTKLVINASFSASCPHYRMDLGEAVKVTPIFFCETSNAVNKICTEYVDITDEFDLKMKMFECHESQLKWLRDHDGVDTVADETIKAKFRGLQCGVKYAEGFTQYIAAQRLVPYRLLP